MLPILPLAFLLLYVISTSPKMLLQPTGKYIFYGMVHSASFKAISIISHDILQLGGGGGGRVFSLSPPPPFPRNSSFSIPKLLPFVSCCHTAEGWLIFSLCWFYILFPPGRRSSFHLFWNSRLHKCTKVLTTPCQYFNKVSKFFFFLLLCCLVTCLREMWFETEKCGWKKQAWLCCRGGGRCSPPPPVFVVMVVVKRGLWSKCQHWALSPLWAFALTF